MVRAKSAFVRTVNVHHPDLVASIAAAARLVDKFAIIWTEVSLAVISFKGKLGDVFHMTVYKWTVTGFQRCIFFGTS